MEPKKYNEWCDCDLPMEPKKYNKWCDVDGHYNLSLNFKKNAEDCWCSSVEMGELEQKVANLMNDYDYLSSLEKNDRGDLVSKKPKGKLKKVTNPFTDEEVPIYSIEEEEILEELYKIDEQIIELEGWLDRENNGEERVLINRDIEKLKDAYSWKEHGLEELRNDDTWIEDRKKAKAKKARAKKAKTAKNKKIVEEQLKEEQRQEEASKARAKVLEDTPDDLKEVMNRLF